MRLRTTRILLLLLCGFMLVPRLSAQALPPCAERATALLLPSAGSLIYCVELALSDNDAGELAFSALTFSDEGVLYGTRPLRGQVVEVRDTDANGVVDTVRPIIEGLTLPNALTWHEGALYIAGDGTLYRWRAGELSILRDDLPQGKIVPHGLIAHQGRLYMGIPADCDLCIPADERIGAVVSMALDGSDLQLVARGLHQASGLAVRGNLLWITDSSPEVATVGGGEELNAMPLDSEDVPHFGWPHCWANGLSTAFSNEDCAGFVPPRLVLAHHSDPFAVHVYTGAAFPHLQDQLLLVQAGKTVNGVPSGYQFIAVDAPDAADTPMHLDIILPTNDRIRQQLRNTTFDEHTPFFKTESGQSVAMTIEGAGFYPHRIYDVAISPQGYIYIASGGNTFTEIGAGALFILRPFED